MIKDLQKEVCSGYVKFAQLFLAQSLSVDIRPVALSFPFLLLCLRLRLTLKMSTIRIQMARHALTGIGGKIVVSSHHMAHFRSSFYPSVPGVGIGSDVLSHTGSRTV